MDAAQREGDEVRPGAIDARDQEASNERPSAARVLSTPAVAALLWILALFVTVPNLVALPSRSTRWDFSHYYLSALVLRAGQNPYHSDFSQLGAELGFETGSITRATYPPTFLVCFEPLTLLAPVKAYWVWTSISVLALIFSLRILAEEASIPKSVMPAAVALALTYAPLWNHFKFAQCQIIVLLLILIMARALRNEKQWLAGVALALATLLRVFPVVLVGYLIARRKWRALLWMGVGCGVGGVATLILVGIRNSFGFLSVIGFLTSPYWLNQRPNVALAAIITRLVAWVFASHSGMEAQLAGIIAKACVVFALAAATFTATRASESREPDRDWRALSMWVVAMILLAPTAWMHYLVLLYFPYAMIFGAALRETVRSGTKWATLSSYLWGNYVVLECFALFVMLFPATRVVKAVAPDGYFVSVLLVYLGTYSVASETKIYRDLTRRPRATLKVSAASAVD